MDKEKKFFITALFFVVLTIILLFVCVGFMLAGKPIPNIMKGIIFVPLLISFLLIAIYAIVEIIDF